jgi:5-deoxy-glucuronate isomerase
VRRLAAQGRETEWIDLWVADLDAGEVLRLAPGETLGDEGDQEAVVVMFSGRVRASVDGEELGGAGGRSGVFEDPGHAVYAPPGAAVEITAETPAALAVAAAPADPGAAGEARIIAPADQRIDEVGEGNWSRTVRTILGPEHAAGRLLLGETINPPGNWSSYPPHKHDEDALPDEAKLEEIYLFKVEPAQGFGVQLRYKGDREEAFRVGDGDVAVIPAGYHPVVAAPGYRLYYLWMLAGERREMVPRLEAEHAWVQEAAG